MAEKSRKGSFTKGHIDKGIVPSLFEMRETELESLQEGVREEKERKKRKRATTWTAISPIDRTTIYRDGDIIQGQNHPIYLSMHNMPESSTIQPDLNYSLSSSSK